MAQLSSVRDEFQRFLSFLSKSSLHLKAKSWHFWMWNACQLGLHVLRPLREGGAFHEVDLLAEDV